MTTTNAAEIAFVNNMPDTAFVETERQFRFLLGFGGDCACGDCAGGALPLRLYAPRERLGSAELDASVTAGYQPVEELFATRPAGVVVTGREPAGGDLRREPLWPVFERIFEWAPEATGSLWLACLAAHAALAHYDGLGRRPLAAKYSAVLAQAVERDHPLTGGIPDRVAIPHSRSNEVPTAEVAGAGYRLAVASEETGWTVATAERGGCLLVAVQGHPEYGADTLLREYRRDVRRFLAGKRDVYPPLPAGYLDAAAEGRLGTFRRRAERHRAAPGREPDLIGQFPFAEEAGRLQATWAPVAARLGRNWLALVAERSPAARAPAATGPPADRRERSAAARTPTTTTTPARS